MSYSKHSPVQGHGDRWQLTCLNVSSLIQTQGYQTSAQSRSDWAQMGNSGIFSYQISVHFGSPRPVLSRICPIWCQSDSLWGQTKMYWNLIWKKSRISPIWAPIWSPYQGRHGGQSQCVLCRGVVREFQPAIVVDTRDALDTLNRQFMINYLIIISLLSHKV